MAILLAGCGLIACTGRAGPLPDGAGGRVPFSTAIELETTAETSANASLGDLDGDGDLDIVLAKGRHWPLADLVLVNDGNGGFAERHDVGGTADRTYTTALADLDGDGDLDLAIGNDRPDEKRIHINDGHGHFQPGGTFGDPDWPTRNITVTDLTGDGLPEIIVANRGGPGNASANYVCRNDGAGRFPECSELSHESATTIAAADINRDGFADLVVPHRDGGQSFVHLNDGRGGFSRRIAFGPPDAATRAVAVGDVDGDGRPDIVVGDDAQGGASVYANVGGSSFEGPLPLAAPADVVYSIAIADLDGDGDADIVLGMVEAPCAVLVNEGPGRPSTVVRFGDGRGAVYGIAIGDVNGDGRPDIVTARSGAPNMLYLN